VGLKKEIKMNTENTEIKNLLAIIVATLIILSGFMAPTAGDAAPKYENNRHKSDKHQTYKRERVIHRGPARYERSRNVRHHRDVTIVRPHGHSYYGYGHYNNDDDAYAWLAFTSITLKVLDNLNEQQQREHEAAQVEATNAKVGETIVWNEAGASGSVTAVRDGTSTSGRYCREFQQKVTIGGNTESAYGTACRQPDGSWEVVSTGA
jgi:hypothetical protein